MNFRRYIVLLIILATLSWSFIAKIAINSDAILGVYESPNGKSKVQFLKKGELYYGKIIWNINPDILDRNNKNIKLRDEKLIGQNNFIGFKYNPYERIWIGKFYDADSGEVYDCNLWLENNNKRLMARGYIEHPLVGRTEALTRLE